MFLPVVNWIAPLILISIVTVVKFYRVYKIIIIDGFYMKSDIGVQAHCTEYIVFLNKYNMYFNVLFT